jgi:glucose-1-phosphate adenylyltransferase
VLAGDHVYRMDYRKMLACHEQTKADVTVGVVQVPIQQAHRFGTVTVDGESRIISFVEKSSTPRSNMVSMGIYVFNTDVLVKRLTEDARADSPHDFGYAVIPGMVKKDRVYDYWRDIGTIEAYYAANMELIRDKPPFALEGAWPVLTGDHSPSLTRVSQQGSVRSSIVSPGCMIKGQVANSILSSGVWVEEQAVVTNSIIMSNVFIGYHSVVDHCILDEEVNVGKLSYVGFRGGTLSDNQGIAVLGKGATVPAHTAIGANCRVLPHVGLADFTASMIAPGEVISPRTAGNTTLAVEKAKISDIQGREEGVRT